MNSSNQLGPGGKKIRDLVEVQLGENADREECEEATRNIMKELENEKLRAKLQDEKLLPTERTPQKPAVIQQVNISNVKSVKMTTTSVHTNVSTYKYKFNVKKFMSK